MVYGKDCFHRSLLLWSPNVAHSSPLYLFRNSHSWTAKVGVDWSLWNRRLGLSIVEEEAGVGVINAYLRSSSRSSTTTRPTNEARVLLKVLGQRFMNLLPPFPFLEDLKLNVLNDKVLHCIRCQESPHLQWFPAWRTSTSFPDARSKRYLFSLSHRRTRVRLTRPTAGQVLGPPLAHAQDGLEPA